jgi:hypothetical protein
MHLEAFLLEPFGKRPAQRAIVFHEEHTRH